MGKMGKTKKKYCTRNASIHTKVSCRKENCSKIEKCTHNSAHTLQEKYKNMLGCRQPIIVLERCSVFKIISHPNCLQVSSKNSVSNICNANDTRKVVQSTNHVSYQSSCIEKTTNLEAVRNLKVDNSMTSENRPKQAAVKKIHSGIGKISSNNNVSEIVLEASSGHSKRNASSKHRNFISKIDESDSTASLDKMIGEVDTKHEVDVKPEALQNGKSLKICLEKIILYDNNSIVINVAHDSGHLQKNNLNERIVESQECDTNTATNDVAKTRKRTKIYIPRTDSTSLEEDATDISETDFPINGTLINDTRYKGEYSSSENLDSVPLEQRLSTTENVKQKDSTSSSCTGNSCRSTLILQAPENLNTITLQEKLIVPSSNELSKHTKKRTITSSQKSAIMENTEDTSSASSRNSPINTVVPSKRFIVSNSNELNKHTKKRTITSSQKSAIMENTEDTSSASSRNSPINTVVPSKRFIVSNSNELSKHTKKRTTASTQESTIIENTENTLSTSTRHSPTNTVESSKRLIVPSSNELSKHTKKRTIASSQRSTIMKNTEDTSFASSRNSPTNTVEPSKRLIMPSSNELSKHTKKRTITSPQKSAIMENTEDTSSASSRNSPINTIVPSKRFIVSNSNELNKHTKKRTIATFQKSTIIENTEDTSSASSTNSPTNTLEPSKRLIVPSSNELSKHAKKRTTASTEESTIMENTENTLSTSTRHSPTNTVECSKRLIVPSSNELSKHTKKRTIASSQRSTIMKNTEDTSFASSRKSPTNTVETSERFIVPSSNELNNHTKKRTTASTQECTIMENTENMLSTSTRHSPTNTVESSKRLIVPSSNELSKHTKKRTIASSQRSTIMKNTEDTSFASSRNSPTNTVEPSTRLIVPSSNELSKHTKKRTTASTQESAIMENTENTLSTSTRHSPTNTVESSKRLIVPSSNELSKHTKKRTIASSQRSTIMKITEDTSFASSRKSPTNTVETSERFIVSNSNKLSKHTKKHTISSPQKSTIMENTENMLSTSTRHSPTNTVESSKRLIVPSSNELNNHTKKRTVASTQKSTIMENTEDTRNLINSSSNTVQSSGKLIILHSNHSDNHTKESTVVNIQENIEIEEKISKEKNIEHDTSHLLQEHKSWQRRKRVHNESSSSSSQDVKKVKLNRASWFACPKAVNKVIDTGKVVDQINAIVELENVNKIIDTRKEGDKTEKIVELKNVNKIIDTRKEVDKTEKTVELKNNGKVAKVICADVPGPSVAFLEKDCRTHSVQVAKANLTEEEGISSIEKQNLTETFGYSNRVECNARIDARKSQQKASTEIHVPVVENTSFISERRYFNNSSQVDEDDCISLFADSMLIEEYDIPEVSQSRKSKETSRLRKSTVTPHSQRSKVTPHSQRSKEAPPVTEKQYVMTDNVFDNYYKKNALEFNEAYNVNYFNNSTTQIVPQRENTAEIVQETNKPDKIVPLMEVQIPIDNKDIAKLALNPDIQTLTNTRTVNQSNQNGVFFVFRGFCYRKIRTGSCYGNGCYYNHNFVPHLMLMYKTNETRFFEVMDDLIQQRHITFLISFYKDCIRSNTNFICILKLLRKFYISNILSSQIIYDSVKKLITNGITVNEIVDNLANIVDASDTQFVTCISQIVVTYLLSGYGWPTLKPLLMRIDKLGEEIIQHILVECIQTQKHVQDVYENVVCKLDKESLSLLNKSLLLQFHSIRRQISENVKVEKVMVSTTVTISSPNPYYEPEIIPYTTQTDSVSSKVWKDLASDSNNNAQGENSTTVLQPIDNVSNPYSMLSRERFWKFYLDVHSLQEGLKHNDYKHVKKILDGAQRRQATPFTTACYNILRRQVEHSQIHLSKLASLAVQNGATATFFKILVDVTIYILVDLAERELWALALVLLNNMESIIHEQCCLFKFDAAVVLLFCEIYLANRKPMKAFILLKQSNIVCTYRGKWKVRNNERDDDIRAQIVTILLDMFCDTSSEYAFSLLEFLIVDQTSNFYPIDLLYRVNKLVSLLLLRNDHELIINIGKLIDNYDCTLYPITNRALISSLVRINLPLAKHAYQSAVLLGLYPKLQFYPIMYIIVKSDWTGEEMYLAIWAMMNKLSENIGHAIEGLKPRNLSSYLVFENTPSHKQLVNKMSIVQHEKKLQESINLMKRVLEREFNPPLFMVQKRKGKLQKMSSQSLYKYLQCNQDCMQHI